MASNLARLSARHPLVIVISWLVLTTLSMMLAFTGFGERALFDRLHAGEPLVAGSDTKEAAEIRDAHALSSDTILLGITGVDMDAAASELPALLASFHSNVSGIDAVSTITSPLTFSQDPQSPQALAYYSASGDGFAMTLDLAVDATDAEQITAHTEVRGLAEELAADLGGAVILSSEREVVDSINGQMVTDLVSGELIALPISLLVMVIVFGGLLAAGMPLLAAGGAIGVALGALWLLSHPLSLESVVVNLASLLGLGLSIDYGLLIVSRYREELEAATEGQERRRRRQAVEIALKNTLATAGRTVTFSAITIALSISGLLLLRPEILRSLAVGGVLVVFLGWLSALTLVPACLSLASDKLTRPSPVLRIPVIGKLTTLVGDSASDDGFFASLARWVTRRAGIITVLAAGLLIVATLPLGGLKLNNSTIEMLPSDHQTRQTWDTLGEDYPLLSVSPVSVLLTEAEVPQVQAAVAQFPELTPLGVQADLEAPYVSMPLLLPDIDPSSSQAHNLVRDLREAIGEDALVYGATASEVDFNDSLAEGAPAAIGIIVLATFVLLFLMTGSILVPLKALVINILSIGASLGITTWIFAEGHGEGILDFTSLGGLESYVVAVVGAFGFGLAMDYEVFLLARIKERYDVHHDNDLAVVEGIQRTGRIITSAALVMMIVFCGFIYADIFAIKQVGFALALAVFLDATLVRMFLVPATMKLLGHVNWWAPKPLRRLHERFGLHH